MVPGVKVSKRQTKSLKEKQNYKKIQIQAEMAESKAIQAMFNHVAIQAARTAVMALREVGTGPDQA